MLLLALYCTYCAPTTFLYTLHLSQVLLWGLKRAMSGYLVFHPPSYLASQESCFESCKTVKNVIPALLTAALYKMRPGRQYVVKCQLLQNI